jgi:hypothetical protein
VVVGARGDLGLRGILDRHALGYPPMRRNQMVRPYRPVSK